MPDNSSRIDFVIAGAQKAGTTALALYLMQHPDIFIPEKKEFHWFKRAVDYAGGLDGLDFTRFHGHFAGHLGREICGEASPLYLYWPGTFTLMREYNPTMKVVVSLRNPVLRAWSGWSMERRRGREPLSFAESISDAGRRRVADSPGGVHLIHSYVERGFYAAQIERMLAIFPRKQVFFLRNDEIAADHPRLAALTDFLGGRAFAFEPIRENVMPGAYETAEPGLAETFARLHALYRPDMERLEDLTGLEVSDWLAGPPSVPAQPRQDFS